MTDGELRTFMARTLDDVVEMSQRQVGFAAGRMLSLHGVTVASVLAAWRQLSHPDQIVLANTVVELVLKMGM